MPEDFSDRKVGGTNSFDAICADKTDRGWKERVLTGTGDGEARREVARATEEVRVVLDDDERNRDARSNHSGVLGSECICKIAR